MRYLTGLQPSGSLHIGNYFGAMKPLLESVQTKQHEYYIFVPDFHAMTSLHDPEQLRKQVFECLCVFYALFGQEGATVYVQSDVAQIQELTWYLHTVCPMGLLERAVSYREKVENGIQPHSGLFTYPVLMAADILLFHIDRVPVGKDQQQHLEIARDLAIKFHNRYGEYFTLPEAVITESVGVVPGIDGRKMSKSYHNTIPLISHGNEAKKAIMSIVTDSALVSEPKNPETCSVFSLYSLFATEEERKEMKEKYLLGGYGYGEAKKELLRVYERFSLPIMERYMWYASRPDYVADLRSMGAKNIQSEAQKTIEDVRKLVGIR